jgi:hypothetical protein
MWTGLNESSFTVCCTILCIVYGDAVGFVWIPMGPLGAF